MTALPARYAAGDVLQYRHKGTAFVGRLLKCQRRSAVIMDGRGRICTVPWTAVDGIAPRKAKPGPVAP